MSVRRGLAWVATLCMAIAAPGPTPVTAQDTHVLVVVGLGGTEAYRERFTDWAVKLHAALTGPRGIAPGNVVVLAERADAAPVVHGRSTRENVLGSLATMAAQAGPEDRILVVLVGHGTAQGNEGSFNLPGPDLGGADFAAAFTGFPTQTVAFVHTGSAGGDFVASISGPRRIAMSATRSARERNATRFAEYFVEALAGDGADLDKDGAISLLEAFTYTKAEVARDYTEANELLTEHAVLDDNGDGEASPDPGTQAPDGPLADAFRFGTSSVAAVADTDDPVLARLYEERREIQARIDALRTTRGSLSAEAYDEALEALLVELALKNREVRAREGGGR